MRRPQTNGLNSFQQRADGFCELSVVSRPQSLHLAQAQRAAHSRADGSHAHRELRELEPGAAGPDGQRLR